MVKPQRYADLQQPLRQPEQQIRVEVGITRRSA